MAVEWPDFSLATITEAKYYNALKAALAERCAARRANNRFLMTFASSEAEIRVKKSRSKRGRSTPTSR